MKVVIPQPCADSSTSARVVCAQHGRKITFLNPESIELSNIRSTAAKDCGSSWVIVPASYATFLLLTVKMRNITSSLRGKTSGMRCSSLNRPFHACWSAGSTTPVYCWIITTASPANTARTLNRKPDSKNDSMLFSRFAPTSTSILLSPAELFESATTRTLQKPGGRFVWFAVKTLPLSVPSESSVLVPSSSRSVGVHTSYPPFPRPHRLLPHRPRRPSPNPPLQRNRNLPQRRQSHRKDPPHPPPRLHHPEFPRAKHPQPIQPPHPIASSSSPAETTLKWDRPSLPLTLTNIHQAVQNGLNYLGICAGALLAGRAPLQQFQPRSGARFDFYAVVNQGIHKSAVLITTPNSPPLQQYWEDGPQFTGWGGVLAKYPDGTPASSKARPARAGSSSPASIPKPPAHLAPRPDLHHPRRRRQRLRRHPHRSRPKTANPPPAVLSHNFGATPCHSGCD